jgi:hypothetical protein
VRDLPRQLSVEELAELFSGRTAFVERLAEIEDPLGRAREVARTLSAQQKREALAAHPRIGDRASEQHGDEPVVLAELWALNCAYEEKFGFRFIVFVNRRSRRELIPVLRERLRQTPEDELETAFDELVAIAKNRWSQR